MEDEADWYVGVDWASRMHRACVLARDGKLVGMRDIEHGGGGLSEFCDWLLMKTESPPERICIAIEVPHGPIVECLLERGFQVFSINPKQLDRFRDRFTVAGAKDDSRDAHVLGDSLRTDRKAFRHLHGDDPLIVELRAWSRIAEGLTVERGRLTNQIGEQLWRYYPQALELADDLGAEWFLTLFKLAPSPSKAQKLSRSTVGRLLKKYHVRRFDADGVVAILRKEPLRVAPGTVQAAMAYINLAITRLKIVNTQLKTAHRKLDELCAKFAEGEPGQEPEQRDVEILLSLPGIARIVLATLLAEASQPLKARDYPVLRVLSGQAPVTRRSGKSIVVLQRKACNTRLKNALYYWSKAAVRLDARSKERYAALRKRGHSHARALRGVGDRLLYVACTMLQHQTPYDSNYHSRSQAAA